MEKSKIKKILREAFVSPVQETGKPAQSAGAPKQQAQPNASGSAAGSHSPSKDTKKSDTDYSEVQRKLKDTMLKASQVMAAAGLGNPNDATDRSLFSKKVRREKNDEGSTYQFDEKELAAIVKVLNNPAAYLNVKKHQK